MRSLDIRWSSVGVAALAALLIPGTLAVSDAFAGQAFGRDSVYAWVHSAAAGGAVIGTRVTAQTQSYGRDSVYASPGGATRMAASVKTQVDVHFREVYGRAGGAAYWFNSRPKAG